MYSKIMVPVELDHTDRIERTLKVAADLAKIYSSTVVYVAIHGKVPNPVALTPEKFAAELDMFAREQGERFGIQTSALPIASNDPAAEIDARLIEAVRRSKADLVVMASHVPGVADTLHLIGSHAAKLVRQLDISVFVVR